MYQLNLSINEDEADLILRGLELHKNEVEKLANRILTDARKQIADIDKANQEAAEKAKKESEEKKEKEKIEEEGEK